MLFYDEQCVYTTSDVSAPGAPVVDGPGLRGATLKWRTVVHDGTLIMPNGKTRQVALMSFADNDPATGPYFVMAAPSFWEKVVGLDAAGVTGVFLHEFSHTRQIAGVADIIAPIDASWRFPKALDDDAVQNNFGSDAAYGDAYLAERDLLFQAAAASRSSTCRSWPSAPW